MKLSILSILRGKDIIYKGIRGTCTRSIYDIYDTNRGYIVSREECGTCTRDTSDVSARTPIKYLNQVV